MKFYKYILVLIIGLVFVSCNDDLAKKYEAKPVALGRMNEIVLLTDGELEEGMIRDSFNFYFGSAYPIMPTPEPLFDIRHFTLLELEQEPLRKELRTYVLLADISKPDSRATKMLRSDLGEERFRKAKEGLLTSSVGRDKWAKKQIIVYLFADGEQALAKVIREKFPAVAQRVNQHDQEQLSTSIYAVRSDNPGLRKKIGDNFGIDLRIPGDFNVAINEAANSFIWLRKDTKDAILNMTVSTYPYTGPEMLTKESISDLRDAYGERYVTSSTEGSYMVTNRQDLPMFESTEPLGENYMKEIRGIWEMTKDYMGGPFVAYAIVNEKKQELVLVDVFVYAAGKSKRNYIQQLDYIVKQASIL
jgi:hypothetical protein